MLARIFLIGALCLGVRHAHAAEIHVTDALGLVRAVRDVPERAKVSITLGQIEGPAPEPVLINVDGLAPDIAAEKKSDGTFVFHGVSAGTWKIKAGAPASAIKRVEIDQ